MKRVSIDSRVDYSLILPVFCLLLIGLGAIYVAVRQDYPQHTASIVFQQLLWIVLGVIASFIVMFFNTKFLWQATFYLYGLGLVLMVLPLFFYSPTLLAATGAKNWITIAGVNLFQPSEFMKISYILVLSRIVVRFLQMHKGDVRPLRMDWYLILQCVLVTLPVLALLALQKDLGTSLVFMAILAGLILVSGVSWKIILPIFLTLVVLAVGFLSIFLSDSGRAFLHSMGIPAYQLNRILAWLKPFDYAQTTAFQQVQGQIAIGSGGLLGKGLQSTNLYVPVRESDMIFTVIAEDFGFLGSIVVIALYFVLIYRFLRITLASNNRFYTYISAGFLMMLLFHIFENIGAVTGLLPLTGIPLPFISQGGSSIISNLIGVGLFLSMNYQNRLHEEDGDRPVRRKKIVLQMLK